MLSETRTPPKPEPLEDDPSGNPSLRQGQRGWLSARQGDGFRGSVGLVVPGFSADEQDWCIPVLRNLAEQLSTKNDVRVIALRYPYRAARYRVFGAEVTALGGGQGEDWRSIGVWARALAVLAAEHRHRRFDVLHAFWATETGALAATAGRMLGIPTIVSLAGGELVGFPDIHYGGQLALTERLKVRLALRLANVVTAGSHRLLALAARRLRGLPANRVHRVPLGVDLRLFRPMPPVAADDPPRLVHVASLTPIKDQATLLRAAAQVQANGGPFVLEIVGSGLLEPSLRAQSERLGLQSAVRFRGEIPHEQLPQVYQRGAAFVLSSRHEAQSMAALEAAACGLPVVGTEVGVVPELAPEAGIAVPVGDAESLAGRLVELLRDPARRLAMGYAARARVAAEFGIERSIERFRELYALLNVAG